MTEHLRVLVTGGRDYGDKDKVWAALDGLAEVSGAYPLGRVRLTVIHGAARGADSFADRWAIANWHDVESYEADWATHGRGAGPRRNQRMLDEGRPDLVLAFPGGAGTRDMVTRAVKAGVPVRHVT